MAKIRGFKPDLWTDEDFVELSPFARLLWIGLWNFSCDNGHIADKPKQIKMRVLPTDDVNCTELLREIESQGLIERGDGWITTPNLTRHQKPDRRYFTTCEKDGCAAPPETVSQRESRRVHAVQPTGTRSAHTVGTPSAHVDGDGEVMVKGTDKRDASASEFDTFWAAYPKKVGKGQAVKAWAAAAKRADVADIIAGLKAACASWKDAGTETRFIPNPATWLNGERWADEPITTPADSCEWVAPPPQDWDAIRAAARAQKAGHK
jgi:hypothetical protein